MRTKETGHEQVPFFTLDGRSTQVDKDLFDLMSALKALEVDTHYSCQGGDKRSQGRAYFLASGRSLFPVLLRIYWRYLTFRLTRSQRRVVKCFTHGWRCLEFALYAGKGTYVRPLRTIAKWRGGVGDDESDFRVTLMWSNAWGFRITVRWPEDENELMTEFVRSLC